ncbi:EamA family transporter [Haloglycomyces albus]|uniref:EamA family transporter n=1 Tax=Haloglycomyces albus TaxID=526067 RepID=UPI00046CC0DC|nr:EamA family transporter [Haloglycomyces albus]
MLNRPIDLIITALAPVMWGTTYAVTTEFLPADHPLTTALIRALPAGLLLVLIARRLPQGSWWWKSAVIGTLNIAAFFALLFIAAYRLPGGVAAVASAVGPLAAAGASIIILRSHIRPRTWILGITGIFGVALVSLTAEARLDLLGVLAGISGAAGMAVSTVLTKRWGQPHNTGPAALAGWQLTWGGLVLLPFALLIEGSPPEPTSVNLLGYLYLGLVNTALGYWLWFRGISRLNPVSLTFLGIGSPLTAALVGWIALGETFTLPQALGFLIAITATVAAQTTPQRQRPALDTKTLEPASA